MGTNSSRHLLWLAPATLALILIRDRDPRGSSFGSQALARLRGAVA